jgi:hypothetical protein
VSTRAYSAYSLTHSVGLSRPGRLESVATEEIERPNLTDDQHGTASVMREPDNRTRDAQREALQQRIYQAVQIVLFDHPDSLRIAAADPQLVTRALANVLVAHGTALLLSQDRSEATLASLLEVLATMRRYLETLAARIDAEQARLAASGGETRH